MGQGANDSEAGQPLTIADFAARMGQTFDVETGGASLRLVLAEVGALPHSPRVGGSFRLEFVAHAAPALPQGTYAVSCSGLRHEIFLVPLGPNPLGDRRYEAIFF